MDRSAPVAAVAGIESLWERPHLEIQYVVLPGAIVLMD